MSLTGSLFPLTMVMVSFETLKYLARNVINSVLAFPLSGRAAIRIFNVPSANVLISSVVDDFGMTLTRR